MVIEIFCGTSRVTACLKQYGLMSSFGVDYIRSKQAAAQVVIADLCDPQGITLLHQWLAHDYVVGIFLAPPCGSASRARQIPLRGKKGIRSGRRPLRDDDNPNGRLNLTMQEKQRVSRANKLYHLTASLAEWAVAEGCLFCVENPQYSLFWATTFWTMVAAKFTYTLFQSCQYGSSRKKKTMLAHNHPAFKAINAKCPGQNSKHRHAAWGVNSKTKKFATSEETAYPMGLAKMIANCFVVALQSLGVQMPGQTMLEVNELSLSYLQKLRATAGVQPRASRIPPLVPTFKRKLQTKPDATTSSFRLFQKAPKQLSDNLPKGSKLLAISPLFPTEMGGDSRTVEMKVRNHDHCKDEMVQTWGIPWTPQEFVKQAAMAKHPMQLNQLLPKRLRDVIAVYKNLSVQQRIIRRTSKLGFWVNRAKELSNDEAEFHASLHPDVSAVLKGKRLLLRL